MLLFEDEIDLDLLFVESIILAIKDILKIKRKMHERKPLSEVDVMNADSAKRFLFEDNDFLKNLDRNNTFSALRPKIQKIFEDDITYKTGSHCKFRGTFEGRKIYGKKR